MQVRINNPKPVTPPKTYDLIGLTANQAMLLCQLVGKVSCADAARLLGAKEGDDTAYELYTQMEPLIKDLPEVLRFSALLRLS